MTGVALSLMIAEAKPKIFEMESVNPAIAAAAAAMTKK
jgi:hypothetical protein